MRSTLFSRIEQAITQLPEESRPSGEDCRARLLQAGVDSVAGLRRLLRNPLAAPDLLTCAAWLIGLARVEELAPELEALVDEKTPEGVLWEVGKGLIGLDAGKGVFRRLLQEAAADTHRRVAVYMLGALRDGESEPTIRAILDSPRESVELRAEAAEALAYLADAASFDTLLRAARDPAPEVRFWVVFALGKLGDERARPRLQEMAVSDHTVVEGWWAISKEARDALECLDSDSDPRDH